MVAGREGRGKTLLDRAKLAAVAKANCQQWLLDDHARIQAMLLGDGRRCDPPIAARLRDKAAKTVIGLERITTGRDEAEDLLECLLLEAGVGSC